MAKFRGAVGYASNEKTRPGVHEDVIVEKVYYGDVLRTSKDAGFSGRINENLEITAQVSVMADAYAYANFKRIRYIFFEGEYFTVSKVELQRPRLILRVGDLYNGPKPDGDPGAEETP